MSAMDRLEQDVSRIEQQEAHLARLRQHWQGTSPVSFLSKDSREALDSSLSRLGVNYPRLAVTALADRLQLSGFIRNGNPQTDTWDAFKAAGGKHLVSMAVTDRLLYGCSHVTVWARPGGGLSLSGDSPRTMTVDQNPVTGEVERATRLLGLSDGGRVAIVYTPDQIDRYTTDGPGAVWKHHATTPNALRVVPVVPLTRRVSLSDTGTSVVADILDLTDAISKLLADGMVGSEYFARPRRWVTGLEIEEDEDGNVVDPFGKSRLMQSEDPETKFGQLDAGRMDGYSDLIATLTQQIGALTGLPAHYLGLHGDQPPSSEAVKASEVQLTTRAYTEQEGMDSGMAMIGWLSDAVIRGVPADPSTLQQWSVTWESPETQTITQAADAAMKLRQIGLPLESVLRDPMGYSPTEAQQIAERARLDALVAGSLIPEQ